MITYGSYRLNSHDAYELTLIALRNGCRSIDTAQLYNNEAEVGRAIKDSNINRSDIFLTTKIHQKILPDANYEKCVLESINKLGTYIDLLLLHAYNSSDDWCKLETIYEKYGNNAHGNNACKIKYIGVSNYNLINLTNLLATCTYKPHANQIEYSPFNQRDDLLLFCVQNNIKVYAYNIFLKGCKIMNDVTVNNKYNNIIAWLLQKNIIPIFGTHNKEHLISNLEIIKIDHNVYLYFEQFGLNKKISMYSKHN